MDFYKIANELKGLRCRVHGKSAEIKQIGKDVQFACCCDDFKTILNDEFATRVKKATTDEIKNIFKKR